MIDARRLQQDLNKLLHISMLKAKTSFTWKPSMEKNIVLLAVGLMIMGSSVLKAASKWEMSEFMISFWGGPEDEASAEAIAQADFNVVMCKSDKLELCRKYGLKALLFDASPELASQLTEDTGVWGYYIVDEPGSAEEFKELAAKAKTFRKADPNHPAYINLLSSGGDYLSGFIETGHPDILSYDYYQWWWGSGAYFAKLEEYRAAALNAGIPLICWVEANAHPGAERDTPTYLPDNAQKLRQSVYTSLAYGVKGIEWFVGPLIFERDEATGTPELTQAGKDVAAINAELKRLGSILVQLRSVELFHTPPLPSGTSELPADYWVQTETSDLIIGMFKDSMQNDYMMVANRKIDHRRQVALRFRQPVAIVEKFDKEEGRWINLSLTKSGKYQFLEFTIAPGDGELLRIR